MMNQKSLLIRANVFYVEMDPSIPEDYKVTKGHSYLGIQSSNVYIVYAI